VNWRLSPDLDAATKAVLDKGSRNVEILKQPQYSPMPVEKQIAVIFCGTRGLLRNIPVRSIHNFEVEYLSFLESNHQTLLKNLKSGQLLDEDVKTMERVCKEISRKYEEKK
jgi:F-type H+-transporting ATPase subunit alpha